jgi:hypothetical protein
VSINIPKMIIYVYCVLRCSVKRYLLSCLSLSHKTPRRSPMPTYPSASYPIHLPPWRWNPPLNLLNPQLEDYWRPGKLSKGGYCLDSWPQFQIPKSFYIPNPPPKLPNPNPVDWHNHRKRKKNRQQFTLFYYTGSFKFFVFCTWQWPFSCRNM